MSAPRFDDPRPCAPMLRELGACTEAVAWVGDRDFRAALADCQRGDWVLWLYGRLCGQPTWPTRQQLTLAACACGATALRYVRPGEDRPRLAIETACRWARGDATVSLGDVRRAAAAAAYAAAAAAAAAAAYAADAYAAAARKAALARMADLLRSAEAWR